MSTRSTLGIRLENGKVKAIYCHWDGYPSNQKPLLKHYTTKEQVEELIALGSLSVLGEEIGVKHPFDVEIDYTKDIGAIILQRKEYEEKYGKMCRAYHRDRGEKWKDVKPRNFNSIAEWKSGMAESWCEHGYLFNPQTGKWKHFRL